MLNELIKKGNSFSDKFTENNNYGKGINRNSENEYFKWLSKVGVYIEFNFKKQAPEMTKQVLNYVSEQSIYFTNYNVVMGYLEAIGEMNKPNKESKNALDNFYNED